LISGQ